MIKSLVLKEPLKNHQLASIIARVTNLIQKLNKHSLYHVVRENNEKMNTLARVLGMCYILFMTRYSVYIALSVLVPPYPGDKSLPSPKIVFSAFCICFLRFFKT
jgi:hypothetical protein